MAIKEFCSQLAKWFLVAAAIPFVIGMRVLRPIVVIRLGPLDIGRIGAMCSADWYLAECGGGMYNKKYFDVFYFTKSTGVISNHQWLKMWKRVLRVSPFWKFTHILDKVNRRLPGFGTHIIPRNDAVPRYGQEYKGLETARCVLNYKKSSIAFTSAEETFGQEALLQLGIPEGKPFICFHARDSAYLKTTFSKRDWSYHDFRDSDIENYLLAVGNLAQQGYYALRMGSVVGKKIECDHYHAIDYALNGKRTEFLDIYLGAKCQFFLCSDTGMSTIPEVFRRPVVYVNWVPLLRLPSFYALNGLIIPKKFYLRKEQRFLTFKEILESEMGSASLGEIFEKSGVELIENTPEEIASVALEMDKRLKGKWVESEEDRLLQESFWDLFDSSCYNSTGLYPIRSAIRIGADFLRQNKFLVIQERQSVVC